MGIKDMFIRTTRCRVQRSIWDRSRYVCLLEPSEGVPNLFDEISLSILFNLNFKLIALKTRIIILNDSR